MRHRAAFLATAASILLVACGGGGGGGGPAASNEVLTQRVTDYFQKAVNQPGLTIKVGTFEEGEMPGWLKAKLEAALGDQKQEVVFYVTKDGRYLFRGDPIDLTVDPNLALMQKIKLDGEPSRGPADAKVTIVEYSDFQCPYCGRAWETLEKEVLSNYGDKVRFVFKQMPLTQIHPWAEDAAVATECAYLQGNDKFWALYNGLFQGQAEITKETLPAKLEQLSSANGIDYPKLKECFDGKKTLDAVKADMAEAQALGVSATPSFVVNGKRLNGAQTADAFKQLIDQELGGGKTG